jgi:hypothetical protein
MDTFFKLFFVVIFKFKQYHESNQPPHAFSSLMTPNIKYLIRTCGPHLYGGFFFLVVLCLAFLCTRKCFLIVSFAFGAHLKYTSNTNECVLNVLPNHTRCNLMYKQNCLTKFSMPSSSYKPR